MTLVTIVTCVLLVTMCVLTDVLEVLMNFFYTLFHGLLSQVGPPLTERITQTFMTLLTK